MSEEQVVDRVFCAACRASHVASVGLDPDGWPRTEWLESHMETVQTLLELAGQLMAHAIDVGDWSLVEYAAGSVLELRDEP